MSDDRLLEERAPDDDLKDAFRSVRDRYDGETDEPNLTLQRALFRARTGERRRRLTRWVVLPIAAALVASTAWAGVTGRLTPGVDMWLETLHGEHAERSGPQPPRTSPPPPPPVTSAEPAPPSTSNEPAPAIVELVPPSTPIAQPPVIAQPIASSPPPASRATTPAEPARTVAVTPPPEALPPAAPVVPAELPPAHASPAASAQDPHAALFAEAHRIHFLERDPQRALSAWDRYLAVAPSGRFAPEARYNRALALVRLGRHAEARSELTPFANGAHGSYRRDEAKALLDALARDAGF